MALTATSLALSTILVWAYRARDLAVIELQDNGPGNVAKSFIELALSGPAYQDRQPTGSAVSK